MEEIKNYLENSTASPSAEDLLSQMREKYPRNPDHLENINPDFLGNKERSLIEKWLKLEIQNLENTDRNALDEFLKDLREYEKNTSVKITEEDSEEEKNRKKTLGNLIGFLNNSLFGCINLYNIKHPKNPIEYEGKTGWIHPKHQT